MIYHESVQNWTMFTQCHKVKLSINNLSQKILSWWQSSFRIYFLKETNLSKTYNTILAVLDIFLKPSHCSAKPTLNSNSRHLHFHDFPSFLLQWYFSSVLPTYWQKHILYICCYFKPKGWYIKIDILFQRSDNNI